MKRFTGYTETTPPAFLPVSLYEMKKALKLCATDTDEDDLIAALIAGATDFVEDYQRRAIVQRGVKMNIDKFCEPILPVLPPLVSVDSITYLDTAGDEQTLDSSLYRVDTVALPGRITKEYGTTWPTTRVVESAVSINYTAGYKKYVGTFDSWTGGVLKADFTDTISKSGVVYVINATGEYEAYGFRSAYNDNGIWSIATAVDAPVNTYAEDDVVEIHAIPESTRRGIIAVASQMYEHPAVQSEVSLSDNKQAMMLLNSERVREFY